MITVSRVGVAALVLSVVTSVTTLAREFNVAEGRLLRLDAGARRLVIRTEQGAQLQCMITGETRVTGAGDSLQGLPAMTRLTVYYAREDMDLVATEVEVHESPF